MQPHLAWLLLVGEVLLDGVDIRSLQLKWLRGQIGLVSQEPALFGTSIAQNILYGKDGAAREEIEEAAKAANAHAFISQLPDGYETQVNAGSRRPLPMLAILLCRIESGRIGSNRVESLRIGSNRIESGRIGSNRVESFRIGSNR
jgi:ABC-type molybdate transport system ATPase subunit